ncbi:MAG TPA: ABC transporter substrate-binding protein [Candidatus Caccousia avicola]|uniref:ABC transporter substrate-binding protein n=1 Tax=Candidatus Caccousia avicola TaxID=2840721 RepID=A0A9D1ALZ6_9FIRM|nr:ABC transporter substrate-binding protein [Candidatus Caccousia avicola]
MKKRILAALMALAMLGAFSGCSNTGDGGSASGGSDSDTIRIGGLAPLTGDAASYGVAVNNAIQMAVEDINANGGIDGKQIEYIYYDEKGDTTEATNAYNKLVQDDKVVAIIGDVTTKPTLAVAQTSQQDNIPIITATATAAEVTLTGPNIFRACFTDPFQGELMASYASEKLGATKVAVLSDMADDYSSGIAEAFVAKAEELGMQVVADEKYQDGDVDFKSQLTNIKGQNPDVLFLPVYYEDLRLISAQAKEVGVTAQLCGADGWDSVLTDNFDSSVLNGGVFCSQYSTESTDERVQNFISAYKEKYEMDPNMFAVLAYDATNMMAQAISDAGSTDSQAIIDAMAALEYDGLTGRMTFDEDRNPQKSAVIVSIQDNAYKFVENYDPEA